MRASVVTPSTLGGGRWTIRVTIQELVERAHKTAKEKGWWEGGRDLGEVLANVYAEVTEAWEEYRHGADLTEIRFERGEHGGLKPEGFPVELADILIRVADLAGAYGIDLEMALSAKLGYNETRPYRHGGLRA